MKILGKKQIKSLVSRGLEYPSALKFKRLYSVKGFRFSNKRDAVRFEKAKKIIDATYPRRRRKK